MSKMSPPPSPPIIAFTISPSPLSVLPAGTFTTGDIDAGMERGGKGEEGDDRERPDTKRTVIIREDIGGGSGQVFGGERTVK